MTSNSYLSKNNCLEILENLNELRGYITELKDLLLSEIMTTKLQYGGDLSFKNVNFVGLTYSVIESTIEYLRGKSNYEESINLYNIKDKIMIWFFNLLMMNSYSYLITDKVKDINNKIEVLCCYNFDLSFINSYYNLLDLENSIDDYIHQYNNLLREYDKNSKKLKADSDYIKRNKK